MAQVSASGASTTDIADRMASLNRRISAANNKIAVINSHIAILQGIDTTVSYALVSHSNIKGTYDLAGKPYAEMAETEEAHAKTVSKGYDTTRDEMIEALRAQSGSISASRRLLEAELANLI